MRRNKNKYILLSLIGILLLMIVGYAGFNSSLKISETSEVTNNWDISITDIKTKSGTATNKTEPSYESLTANFDVNFQNIGDYIEYDVTVTNNGNVEAYLNTIDVTDGNNEVVNMSYSGIDVGEKLGIGQSKTFTVKLLYKGGSGEGTSEITIGYGGTSEQGTPVVPINSPKVVYDYETNGGTGEIKEKYFVEGESVDLNITGKKEGYTFVGWSADKDATETITELLMTNEDTILYAIYKKEIKVTYKMATGIYKIGKESDSCFIYNNEESCTLILPNIEAKEGYIVDGWYDKKDNIYEIGSEVTLNESVSYEARSYDPIPAELTITTSKTTKSITVVANIVNNVEIKEYEYSMNGGETWITKTTNTYTFDELDHDTLYNIKVKVITKANIKTESEIIEVKTDLIEAPAYSITPDGELYAQEKILTIDARCKSCTNEYSIDGGETWNVFPSDSFDIKFLSAESVIARSSDGKNIVTSNSYTVTNIDSTPSGVIKFNASDNVPGGYLPCDGRAVSRTTYKSLFETIGITYGEGDGRTTFNLPDLRGNVPVGKSSSTFTTLGATGGSINTTLKTENLPSHSHTSTAKGTVKSTFTGSSATTSTDGAHTHSITTRFHNTNDYLIPYGSDYGFYGSDSLKKTTSSAGDHSHTVTAKGTVKSTFTGSEVTSSLTGSGTSFTNMQPYIISNYIIKY